MKTVKYISLSLLALCTVLVCGGYYMLGFSLKPDALVTSSRNLQSSFQEMCEEYPVLISWMDSIQQAGALRERYIDNEKGENLHAYYIEAAQPTNKTAVIVHGYTDNAIRMMHIGYLYSHELGYNILLPDLHAHGASDGDAVQMGWLDRLDVLQWTATADELFGRDFGGTQMVVHGISMGAATTMMVAGEVGKGLYQQPYIKCFVEDCGYTNVWDQFAYKLKQVFSIPSFPLIQITSTLCEMEYGWNFQEASALEQVRKCQLPMLFIHGDNDTYVPTPMVYELYEAKPEPKELWIAPGSAHAKSYKDHPHTYTEKVQRFVEKYIHQVADKRSGCSES